MNKSNILGRKVYDLLIRPRNGDFVDVNKAIAYAHRNDGSIHLIAAEEDVYDLLESLVIPKDTKGVSLVTVGWAAPLEEDGTVKGKPSKHPEKRRVRLIASITQEDRGSVLEWADTLEIVEDEGEATGSLADALEKAWNLAPVLSW